jgi:hypothetical protein
MHPEKLHLLLLQQLETVQPEVCDLSPLELLLELHGLQERAWRFSGGLRGGPLGVTEAGFTTKPLGDKTEDFLVEQVGWGGGVGVVG